MRGLLLILVLASALLSAIACRSRPAFVSETTRERVLRHAPLGPPPADPTNRFADDLRAARFGQALFYDARLSADGTVACATCHEPANGFADGKPLAEGLAVGTRHTPSLLDVAHHRWFFWDGRADSLWAQALQPLETAHEHGGNRVEILRVVASDPRLAKAYRARFGELPDLDDETRFPAAAKPVPGEPEHPHDVAWRAMDASAREEVDRAFSNLGKALAAYERRLVSGPSRFDEFVTALAADDPEAFDLLSAEELHGLELFVGKANCRACHAGPGFTDREFHDTRVAPLGGGRALDSGRFDGVRRVVADPFNGAGRYSDEAGEAQRAKLELRHAGDLWGQFKTPSLRNVALTAPYMHQGQFATLDEVVRFYSRLEGALPPHDHGEITMVALDLTEVEERALVAFLKTLTGTRIDVSWEGPPR